jgi:hypothetical protein
MSDEPWIAEMAYILTHEGPEIICRDARPVVAPVGGLVNKSGHAQLAPDALVTAIRQPSAEGAAPPLGPRQPTVERREHWKSCSGVAAGLGS